MWALISTNCWRVRSHLSESHHSHCHGTSRNDSNLKQNLFPLSTLRLKGCVVKFLQTLFNLFATSGLGFLQHRNFFNIRAQHGNIRIGADPGCCRCKTKFEPVVNFGKIIIEKKPSTLAWFECRTAAAACRRAPKSSTLYLKRTTRELSDN